MRDEISVKELRQKPVLPTWFPYKAISLFGTIYYKRNRELSEKNIQHETIHYYQQRELLYLPFFVLYISEFIVRFLTTLSWSRAYRNISFEREAYDHELTEAYLEDRSTWAWYPYMRSGFGSFVRRKWWLIVLVGMYYAFWLDRSEPSTTPVFSNVADLTKAAVDSTHEVPAPSAPPEVPFVPIRDLVAELAANEVRFDAKYSGKKILIQGTVDYIAKGLWDYHIGLVESGIICQMDESETASLSNLNKGDVVTILGTVSETRLVGLSLKDCQLR